MKNLLSCLVFLILCITVNAQSTLCPDPGATRKRVASSFHSTIMIDYNGDVKYWGDGANPAAPTGNSYVLSPTVLAPALYSGTPVAVAAGSMGIGGDALYNHQLFLLTTTGLYGWGASNGTITTSTGAKTPIVSMALLTGVTAADINFITASGGGIAIVTNITGNTGGSVYIKNGIATGGGSPYTYGDGTTTGFTTTWHRVSTSTGFLTGVARLSYSQKALMAQTADGQVYAWGEQVWAGTPIAVGNQALATLVELPQADGAPIIPADVNVISKTAYAAANAQYATQFILGANQKLYAVGEGHLGILGQGTDVDATNWVTVKGTAGGNTELTGIVQISSNNAYVYADAYYSIGALNADGQLFLWGQNSNSIVGGATANYTLPRIPPNFSVNDARIGYFHMGGHTTIAFLRGSNRFCYIGHLIRGSMGDGTADDKARTAFDCINTPNAYVCTPPPPLGCAQPSSNDLVASSNHATLVINGQPSVTYWGQASSSAEAGVNVPTSRVLYEYNGTPIGVAASAVNETTGATQMWILTSQGLWGWGYSARTVSDGIATSVGLTNVALPVPISNVNFIRSSRGGVALVTTTGLVYIKAGSGSTCSASVYGDGTATLNSAWHKVTKTDGTDLTGVTELSFGGTAAMAITPEGAYTWGANTYLGNNTAMANRTRATLMTLPAEITGTVVAKTAEIIQSGTNGSAQFLLASNGIVYSLGSDLDGVLGLGGIGEQRSFNAVPGLTSVRKLSSNNPYANGFYSIGALTLTGSVLLWGSNNGGMLGADAVVSIPSPTLATGTTSNSIAGFEMGGHQTILFPKASNQFVFAGHSIGGSKGDNSVAANYTTFTGGAEVANCAGVVYGLSGHIYNDANGLTNGRADGTPMSSIAGQPLYVNILDESGYVVGTTPVNATTGGYTFSSFPSGLYTVQVSTTMGTLFAPAPTWTLPTGWSFSGEQDGVVPNTGIDPVSDGRLNIALVTTLTDANIGFNRLPSASSPSVAAGYIAPVGINRFVSPTLTGSDPEDLPTTGSLQGKTILVSTLPANGKIFYNGSQLAADQQVANYDPALLTIDPDYPATSITFEYKYADAAGATSNPASVTLALTYASVSGSVVNDPNGLNDAGGGILSGPALNAIAGTPLYVSLIDPTPTNASGTILATVPVQPNGTYTFAGNVPAGSVQIILHTTPGTLTTGGSLLPSIPAGWGNAGEQSGITPGNGFLPPANGIVELTVVSGTYSDMRFGVDQKPKADSRNYTIAQPSVGQVILLNGTTGAPGSSPDQLTGSDPEDAPSAGAFNGNTLNRRLMITAIPARGELRYNGAPVAAGQEITNYNKNLLALVLTGAGYSTISFRYAWLDAASVASDTATYTVNWAIALPVELVSFRAYPSGSVAKLEWSTSSEQHNRGFDLERSADGRMWSVIGFVPSAAPGGNSSSVLKYAFTDRAPFGGTNHYRLKQIDIDNHSRYSAVQTVTFNGMTSISVMPNPAASELTVRGLSVGRSLQLTNTNGLLLQSIPVTGASQTVDVSRLPAGVYILQVMEKGKRLESVKFMKK